MNNSLNQTPQSERLLIGIFGERNAGKSTLINAFTGQDTALVSPVKGTTTDPVYKSMELSPIGPVTVVDTAGVDDNADTLGKQRVAKTFDILRKTDVAILVSGSEDDSKHSEYEKKLIDTLNAAKIKYITVKNNYYNNFESTIDEIKTKVIELIASSEAESEHPLIADLIEQGDIVILVTPIDSGAPKGRLILPQQGVIRETLESQAVPMLVQPEGLKAVLNKLKSPPKLVITDSQAFAKVSAVLNSQKHKIRLTSFSILFARYKGVLKRAVQAAKKLDTLQNGDTVVICEGCTHHRQCDDIGTVKLPRMLEKHSGMKLQYKFTSGKTFPAVDELKELKPHLIIHCGGCMQSRREILARQEIADKAGIPMCNYGIAIAHILAIDSLQLI